MSARTLSLSRRTAVCTAAGLALLASLLTWQGVSAKDEPPAAAVARNVAVAADLTRLVDVELSDALQHADGTQYYVEATLTNTSPRPLAGPLLLAVKSTGLRGLRADQPEGYLATGEAFFTLYDGEVLGPDKSTETRRITLRAERELTDAQVERFNLRFRIVLPDDGKLTRIRQRQRTGLAASKFGLPSVMRGGNDAPGNAPQNAPESIAHNAPDNTPAAAENGRRKAPGPFQPRPDITDEMVQATIAVQNKHTPKLLKQEGVFGTSTGVSEDGELVIRVYVERHGIADELPEALGGIPVEAKVTARFRPAQAPPQGKTGTGGSPPVRTRLFPVDTSAGFDLPVPVGVSVGLPGILGSGTLGFRLRAADGTLYALSNNHVFASENSAPLGTVIVQPGPLDTVLHRLNGTGDYPSQQLGTLAAFVPLLPGNPLDATLVSNRVDAAIIRTDASLVDNSSVRGSYGVPNSQPVKARLGMKVEKVGRTTGVTTAIVTGVNAIAVIPFGIGPVLFTDQIEITSVVAWSNPVSGNGGVNPRFPPFFGDQGDSGSGIVTVDGDNPVGLYFADGTILSLANPIDLVLEELSAVLGQELVIDGAPSNVAR